MSLLLLIVSFDADAQILEVGEECRTQYDSLTNKAKGHRALPVNQDHENR